MRYKNYNKVLNWQEITELVKQETLALLIVLGLLAAANIFVKPRSFQGTISQTQKV